MNSTIKIAVRGLCTIAMLAAALGTTANRVAAQARLQLDNSRSEARTGQFRRPMDRTTTSGQIDARNRGTPAIQFRGIVTHVPSTAGGEVGIAVSIIPPKKPRYEAGAPVAISVSGGHSAGNVSSRMNVAGCGFVEMGFAFPSGGQGQAKSGGTYDYRGPKSIEALRDVILFAMGKTADNQGRKIQELVGEIKVLTSNVGVHGGSHGGNACGAVMGLWGQLFPELAWYVSMESPYGEGAVGAEIGSRRERLNPAYHPETGILDLAKLAYDPHLELRPFGAGRFADTSLPTLHGSLFFDMDGDGRCESEDDFRLQPPVFDLGQGSKSWYSVQLIREAHKRGLFGDSRPAHMPTLAEAIEFWRYRDATGLVAEAVRKIPNVAVIVVAGETDHVQIAPDHPHIRAQVNAFQKAGAQFIRLNPDCAYVEWLLSRQTHGVPDNNAGLQYTPKTIRPALCPDGAVPKQLLSPAAICELADRVQASNFEPNLHRVLFHDTPKSPGPPSRQPPSLRTDRFNRPGGNLLQNPGFERGAAAPAGWTTFSPPDRGMSQGITYALDDTRCHSGKRSVSVESASGGTGMWQQVVDVEPGRVYVFTGYVAFERVSPQGGCCLQLVFRDAGNEILKFVYFPSHTDSRQFAFDFPPKLKVRAPDDAALVEVNLFLRGTGKAWFDDLYFGLAPTGVISGTVTCRSKPVERARVFVWGDPWDKTCDAFTDPQGQYRLAGIPVAFPRYVLLAAKDAYRTRAAGDVEVKEGGNTTVDFELQPGRDPDDLRVKFGTLSLRKFVPPARIPDGATIPTDAASYPEAIRPYLKPDEYIQSDHPDVMGQARELVETLPVEDRTDTRKASWVLYEWVSRHIDHGGVFAAPPGGLRQPYRDVTSGIWQTIGTEGWCWGKSFLDWCYRPNELLKVESGICVEHAWLVSAMLRSLNIPARASVGSLEFWAQDTAENGAWIHMSTTGGRTNFRERGLLGPGFEGGAPEDRFSVLSRPILHEDWNAQNKGLWRERHPWAEWYEDTEAGYRQATAHLAQFATTGEAPRARPLRVNREQEQRNLSIQRQEPQQRPADRYQIHYSDVTINLFNIGDQRTLDVRFPLVTDSAGESTQAKNAYWTNHPKCARRTWVERITNPPVEGTERWFHIEFDLTALVGKSNRRTPPQ